MSNSPERTALGRLGAWAYRRRLAVVLIWVGALVGAVALSAAAAGDFSADYTAPGTQSRAAAELLRERFDDSSEDMIDVVWSAPAGAVDPSVRRQVDRVLSEIGRLEGIAGSPATRSAEVSRDGSVAVVRVALDRRTDAVPDATTERLLELAHADRGQLKLAMGHRWLLAEPAGLSSEVVGLAVAALVLLVTFGTLVAAGLPIALALVGLGVSGSLVGVLAAVTDVPDWAPQVGAMIGLGVGIDYALLILTRHREALASGSPPVHAVAQAIATAGRSVLIAGATVVVSLVGLFVMRLPHLYGVALAAMLAVLVVMAAAITLLPALLSFMGERVNRLRIPLVRARRADAQTTPAARWARTVQRRPLLSAACATALLVVLALPVSGLRLGFPDAGNDRARTTTREAYDLLAAGFGPGAAGPLLVVAETPTADDRAALALLRDVLRRQPGVSAVSAIKPNRAGDAALISIQPATSPQTAATADLVRTLRDGPLSTSGIQVNLGGATASTVDQSKLTAERLPIFIACVVGLSFLLLLAAFRAPVVAAKAGVMNLLSIGAAYGVVALLAEGGWAGQLVGIDTDTPVPPFIPVMMFALLFGLSMDYEVFLLSRVQEQLDNHGDTSRAVVEAVARTARVITAAAAIMIAVFGAFALSPEVFLKLIGLGLATAILVDATVVRMVLAPAVMELLGERNWWLPTWLDRVLPRAPLEAADTAPG